MATSSPPSPLQVLAEFSFERILSQDARSKTAAILGSSNKVPTILHLERLPLDGIELAAVSSRLEGPRLTDSNDIYAWLLADLVPSPTHPSLKIYSISPATEAHIKKYSTQKRALVRETPEVYARIVDPFVRGQDPGRIQWVYNILMGKKEVDRVVFKDGDEVKGFVLLPDSKWDGKNVETLYLQTIVNDRSIRSLRDLRAKHLPLLKNIRDKILTVVPSKFPDVSAHELRLYIHYQPSYYHLHVHVTNLSFESPGQQVGQAHLLDDVIDNIEVIDRDYYAKRTLVYALGTESPLFGRLVAEGGEGVLCAASG
ncbi:HIT-like domain-containing protein [Blyttiomyces helicus]|uniref:m7GpppX diphosphatase n=1 Tax=Blyttiomyces helicus TaxID=388810 RepID=A0A4P9W4B1_9FUNG|nr:HIT-like domain-containing protein [Blyttiomyces helicus]|eukprot:RKO87024.1 HIT-like domain-containing protein [Blyttiomyces helicus]